MWWLWEGVQLHESPAEAPQGKVVWQENTVYNIGQLIMDVCYFGHHFADFMDPCLLHISALKLYMF